MGTEISMQHMEISNLFYIELNNFSPFGVWAKYFLNNSLDLNN